MILSFAYLLRLLLSARALPSLKSRGWIFYNAFASPYYVVENYRALYYQNLYTNIFLSGAIDFQILRFLSKFLFYSQIKCENYGSLLSNIREFLRSFHKTSCKGNIVMQEPDRRIRIRVCSWNSSFEALLLAVGPIFENYTSNTIDKK